MRSQNNRNVQAKCFRHDVRPTSAAKGVTPGKSPGHNDEGIDEQGTESGSIPDARIVLYLVMGREKVRSIRTPAVLSSLW
jgi:hypothetical protein